jgi:hypothetical protein
VRLVNVYAGDDVDTAVAANCPGPFITEIPAGVGLPCDRARMEPLVHRVYRPVGIPGTGVPPGQPLTVQLEKQDGASADPVARMLLDPGEADVSFTFELWRKGQPAGANDVSVTRGSLNTPMSSSNALLAFLPRPDVGTLGAGKRGDEWLLKIRGRVTVKRPPGCTVDVTVPDIKFTQLPLEVPTVAFLFDRKNYELGFLVAAPEITVAANKGKIIDAVKEETLRAPTLATISTVVRTVMDTAQILSVFGPPFPNAARVEQIKSVLTKAAARAASNRDFAISTKNTVEKMGDIWLWSGFTGASADNMPGSLFMVSAPRGPSLSVWRHENFVDPNPEPEFQVPDDSLCASLTTLESLDTDTVSALREKNYSSWFRPPANFFYNEASSYRWNGV